MWNGLIVRGRSRNFLKGGGGTINFDFQRKGFSPSKCVIFNFLVKQFLMKNWGGGGSRGWNRSPSGSTTDNVLCKKPFLCWVERCCIVSVLCLSYCEAYVPLCIHCNIELYGYMYLWLYWRGDKGPFKWPN